MGDGENSKALLGHVLQVLGQDGVVMCPVCRFIIVGFRGPIGRCFSSSGEGARVIGHMTSAVREFHLYLVTTRLRGLPSDLIGWIGEKYYF